MTERFDDDLSPQQGTEAPSAQAQDPGQAQESGAESSGSEAWFDQTWTKVHPLSPLVRGWVTIVAIPAAFFTYNWQMWTDLWEAFRSGELQDNLQSNPLPYLIGGGAFLLLAALIFIGFTLSWWFTRYKITDEHVMVKSGIFVRQHRQARIDRVQAVDLRQPLLARLTKLAELRFEVAEGDGTAATLAFLRKHEAEQLRGEIMDRAAGRTSSSSQGGIDGDSADSAEEENGGHFSSLEEPPTASEAAHSGPHPEEGRDVRPTAQRGQDAAERQIVRVPVGRLIGSVLVGGTTLVFVVLLLGVLGVTTAIAIGTAITGDQGLQEGLDAINMPFFLPILIAAAFGFYSQFSSGFKFTATMTVAGLRLRYGLLETNTQTVPPGRVQALQVQQGLLWRPFGWYKVVVTVAGYGLDSRTTLLPVGKAEDVMQLTAEMFPDLRIENPEQMFIEGLRGRGIERGFTEVPARARVFDPLVRRRRGFFTTPTALMIRDGRMARLLTMVPHERIQSAALHQGPWARAKKIATLNVHIPAGPITARVKNQDLEQIRRLFDQETGYAAVARRLSDRNQWMLPEELQEFEKMVEDVKDQGAVAGQGISAEESAAPTPVSSSPGERL